MALVKNYPAWEDIKYNIHRDVFTGMYYALLLGGEFDNCYGQGVTEEEAFKSLKLRIIQLRNKQKANNH